MRCTFAGPQTADASTILDVATLIRSLIYVRRSRAGELRRCERSPNGWANLKRAGICQRLNGNHQWAAALDDACRSRRTENGIQRELPPGSRR